MFTDHKVCLENNKDKELVEKEIKKIKGMEIRILSVGIGSHIDIRELKEINSAERKVMRFGEYTNKEIVGRSISHGMLLLEEILKSINTKSSLPVFVSEG